MFEKEKKRLRNEIIISTIVILLLAIIITLFDSCHSEVINIHGSKDRSLVLRIIIQTVGLFLGFIITAIVMKFNQLDGVIQKLGEDLNTIMNASNHYRNRFLSQKRISDNFEIYLGTNPPKATFERQILINFNYLYEYRSYHKDWFKYPLYYSLITLAASFLLLIFQETISNNVSIYVFIFSMCCLMAIWVIYTNVSFALDFLENPFIKE